MKDYNDKSGLAYYWLEANIGRVLLVVLFAWLGVWGLLLEGRDELGLGRRLVRGMGPELAGIVIAAVTIDALAEREQRQSHKAQLIRQLGSKYRDVTEIALLELKHEGWLSDGSLKGSFLWKANLVGADLTDANLSEAHLVEAELNGAAMWGIKLNQANLEGAILSDAKLGDADLSGANLFGASLDGAILEKANLNGTILTNTGKGLRIFELGLAKSLEGTVMPDGVRLRGVVRQRNLTKDMRVAEIEEFVNGPTFEEWKAQYLAKHGGTETDLRDTT